MINLRSRQRGAALLLVIAGLAALLAVAGFAIDTSHLGHNKARLQSTVDAAALAAAKVLDQTNGAEDPASAAALSVFGINAAAHPELQQVTGNGLQITLQYSNTLQPFVPGTAPALYARVIAQNFTMWAGLLGILGINQLQTAASAVAGPSTTFDEDSEVCDLAPMTICGDPAAGPPYFGYELDTLQVLKLASGNNPGPIGPGNFQLIRLNGNGGAVVRQNMAGSYDSCIAGDGTVDTQPGNVVGPVTQGLNTRFGEYQGAGVNQADHPPDVVVTEPGPILDYDDDTQVISQGGTPVQTAEDIDFNYADYVDQIAAESYDYQPRPDGPGVPERRIIAVPISDCTPSNQGQSTLDVLGFACYFLLQRAIQRGNDNYVYGQFVDACRAEGTPGEDPNGGWGPYRIQLYDDVGSGDS